MITKPFQDWTLDNYTQVLNEGGRNAFVNSLVVSLPATIIPILIAAFAAYAFTFMEFPGRDFFFILIVGLLVVPLQVALVPLLKIYGSVGLQGTFASVWLAHAAFGMPLAIFILRGYMATLASRRDRVGEDRRGVALPDLLAAHRADVGARAGVVRDLPVPVDLERPAGRPDLPRPGGEGGAHRRRSPASSARSSRAGSWSPPARSCRMIVPLIVFLALQRFFVRGLTAGAVKG